MIGASRPSTRHGSLTRRALLRDAVVVAAGWPWQPPGLALTRAATPGPKPYDLLIRRGRVIDPAQNLSAPRDVAIVGHSIARVATDIPESQARQVLDASGAIVTPGLIDVHVHVYEGVAPVGVPADSNCVAKGATTVIDAGSAGAHTFPGFRKYVIDVAQTRIRALLNLSVVGQSSFSPDNKFGELLNLNYANPALAVRTIEANRPLIVGIKLRLSKNIAGDNDLLLLRMAKEAAGLVKLPLMVHVGSTHTPLSELLPVLGAGDVVTHCFHGRKEGILDANGRVLPEVRSAVARGVRLDVGHGEGSFSFDVAERAIAQGLLPDTISSDLHQFNIGGPVFDLATTLSKFLLLGLTIEQVIEKATSGPARTFDFSERLGTLAQGAEADVAILRIQDGDFSFVDAMGKRRAGTQKLVPVATIKGGKLFAAADRRLPIH